MAVLKNPIPYYTLKQASKVLNKNFETDIYSPKTVLKMALLYDLKLYVFFCGDWDIHCDIDLPLDLEKEDNHKFYKSAWNMIHDYMKFCTSKGALIELDIEAIRDLNNYGIFLHDGNSGFKNVIEICDVFQIGNLDFSYRVVQDFNLFDGIDCPLLNTEQINQIETLAVYFNKEEIEASDSLIPKFHTIKDEEFSLCYPIIKTKDVLITHIQLEKIINETLKNRIYENLEINNIQSKPLQTHNKRGVSQNKLDAKLAAQTLADYLWRQDKEQKIRISEMAVTVYGELYQTNHFVQLPDKAQSVENWIKSIADKYPHSRQAGRPKNG